MSLSSDQFVPRGLDAMLIVYSLLDNHPASSVCESFIREHTRWLTTTLTLLEAKAILTKVYTVEADLASQQLSQFSAGPIDIIAVDLPMTLAAMSIADTLKIDITDAVLVQAACTRGANILATEDRKLIQVCSQVNLTPETPIDDSLRKQMVNWEAKNLSQKGLPRILRRIHQWLHHNHQQVAEDFWSQTGGGSHLP
ncbi:MAG: PIN domain-containing protein [Candidatus Poribacteria bacterium]|nr:PIN domain-containing protein [Candidatus Poribacteria bacterium]